MQKYIEITKAMMPNVLLDKTFHTTFIVKKGKIIKIGENRNKTHPQNLKSGYIGVYGENISRFVGVHSELSAILKYGKDDCSDCVFWNVRIDKNGNSAMSKPCRGCQDLLRRVGFKKLFFTNNEGIFEEWK